MKRFRKVTRGGLRLLEILDAGAKSDILTAVLAVGCYNVRDGVIRNSGHRYADTLSKILARSRASSFDCWMEPKGAPVLLAFLRMRHQPWCVLIETRYPASDAVAPRMYLMSCQVFDETLFDGSVLEATLWQDSNVLCCKDVSVFRGSSVGRLPLSQRADIVREVATCAHAHNSHLDEVEIRGADWRSVSAEELNSIVERAPLDEQQQLFVGASETMWRTPVIGRKAHSIIVDPVSSS